MFTKVHFFFFVLFSSDYRMTTTTGDPSALKSPSSLSGGDLVSRLLAATPPYLYNVPLTPHSFFFSEMLRSFVQAKADVATTSGNATSSSTTSSSRRRKRTWREAAARERPLELTTKDRHVVTSHHHHQHVHEAEKFFRGQENIQVERIVAEHHEQKPASTTAMEPEVNKPAEESSRHEVEAKSAYQEERAKHFEVMSHQQAAMASAAEAHQRVKPEEVEKSSYEDRSEAAMQLLSAEQKQKLEFASRNLLGAAAAAAATAAPRTAAEEMQQQLKGFGLGNPPGNSEFLPGPMWYPPYPMPPQTYPGIDPLHFFIDLRVSGHIWDRKMQNEKQQLLSLKSKHTSAFSVPQSKEFINSNRPLNLTREEGSSSSSSRNFDENHYGTHYILKHLQKTYRDIQDSGNAKVAKCEVSDDEATQSQMAPEGNH